MRRTVLVFFAVLALAPGARAAVTFPSSPVLMTDGEVDQLRYVGNDILVSGYFGHIGPFIGGGLGMDPASGAIDPAFPQLDGQVSDAIDDGSGGWYVGGQFLVDGAQPVRHLAHILSSGALDTSFQDASKDFVTALALSDGRLYATRWFDGGVRAYDAATGALISGFKQADPPQASELEVADGRLYVGGEFAVFALDPATGAKVQGFDCRTCQNGQVSALAHDGTRLFVGNRGGRLFAVDLGTGARDDSFDAQPGRADAGNNGSIDNGPLVLAIDGNRLLVGGNKLQLGGPSSTLVALDKTTGAADPSFAAGLDQPVHDMVLRGDTIVASGAGVGDASPQLTTLDRATGAVRNKVDTSLDGPIDALAGTGARMFVGGRFGIRATTTTSRMALVDPRTGGLVPGFEVQPGAGHFSTQAVVATGHALVFWNEQDHLPPYVGGGPYRHTATSATLRMHALSLSTGRQLFGFHAPAIHFDPRGRTLGSRFPGGQQYAAAVAASGDRIYVGHVVGDPTTVWPQSRIVVLSATSGRILKTIDLPFKGYLTSLAVRRNRLFAGGSFRRSRNGRPANLATLALNATTGAVDPFFDAHTHGPVYGLGIAGSRLYLTGLFHRIYPIRRTDIAAVDLVVGSVDPRFRSPLPPYARGRDPYVNPDKAAPFGSPFDVGGGLVAVAGPFTPLPGEVLDATTGRRVGPSFSNDNTEQYLPNPTLPVGHRSYVGENTNYIDLPYFGYAYHSVTGFLP